MPNAAAKWLIACALAAPTLAFAQAAPTQTPPPTETVAQSEPGQAEALVSVAATVRIPAGTVVEVELTEALGSETSHQGDMFALRLVAPIVIDGREIVPAGAIGRGEVIDAVPSGFGGRQGRLIVSGRLLDLNGQQVRIRGMQLTAVGESHANTALAVSMVPYAGVASIFIQGGEIEIPIGARGTARIAVDVDVPIAAPEAAPAAAPTNSAEVEEVQ